jgi:two-component system LytT family response regulator
LATLARDLDPAMFVRIHRSTIVRVDRIRAIVPESHGDATIVLKDGVQLEASRNHRRQLERAISGR